MVISSLVQRTFVVLDVAGFSRIQRNDRDHETIRATLRHVVGRAFAESGLDDGYESWAGAGGTLGAVAADAPRSKDSGDGMILTLPERVALPDRVLYPWLPSLAAELRHANRVASEATTIRLRIAVHQGYFNIDRPDGDGTSTDLILACRLIEADPLRRALDDAPDAVFALLVSDPVYQGVVRHHPRGVDPATYRHVVVKVKEVAVDAWLHVPAGLDRPLRSDESVTSGGPESPPNTQSGSGTPAQEPGARDASSAPPSAPDTSSADHTVITFNGSVRFRDLVPGNKTEHHHYYPGRTD